MTIFDFAVICVVGVTISIASMSFGDYLREKEHIRLIELTQVEEVINEPTEISIDLYMPESYFELWQYNHYLTEPYSNLEQALRDCRDRDI